MWGSMEDMNDAVLGVADHLEKLPEARRRAIGDKLREEPDLAVSMFEAIDGHAAKMGIVPYRRMQLRSIAMQAGWRLRAQPVSLLIDEHVQKVRTIAARENQRLLQEIESAPEPTGSPAGKVPGQRTSATVATVGAILLGCSVAVGLVGGALVAAGSSSGGVMTGVGLVMITVGVLGAVGGLITLLVGAIMAAAGK
jgi:hypothetical protein